MKRTLFCLTVACAAGLALAEAPRMVVLQDAPSTGTKVRLTASYANTVPVNQRYSELDSKARAAIAARYENLGQDDEPPYPRDGMEGILSAIGKASMHADPGTALKLIVDVGADGKATRVSLMEPYDNREMFNYAAAVLMQTPFKPGLCKGSPCAMPFPYAVEFARGTTRR